MNRPILYCGDPHGKFDHILRAATQLQPVAVILLGDLEPLSPLHTELAQIADITVFIHGNHDTDSRRSFDNIWGSKLANKNLDGKVLALPDGTNLAGLGGVFREQVWHPAKQPHFHSRKEHATATPRQDRWQSSVVRKHWSSIYPETIERLRSQQTHILITHEAPSYHPFGFKAIDNLANQMGAKVVVHGHHHDAIDSSASWEKQGFKSFGVGLRGITAIDAAGNSEIIVPGETNAGLWQQGQHCASN